MSTERLVLDIGCGKAKHVVPGCRVIGLDVNPRTDADVLSHLDSSCLPFKDSLFEAVYCIGIMEHVADVFHVLGEIHRVCRNGAIVYIEVPHFSSADAYGDPTHRRAFTTRSLNYVTGHYPEFEFYQTYRFKKRKVRITFWPITELGNIRIQEWFGIGLLANKLTSIYERFLAFWFPAQAVWFELEVVKPATGA